MGPVGSLERPRDTAAYERFDLQGSELWVHREILDALEDPSRLRFHFGKMGWCSVSFE